MNLTDNQHAAYRFDLFISYAQIDNDPLGPGGAWVTQLVHDLGNILHRLTGRAPRIWFDRAKLQPGARLSDQIQQALLSSALLVPVLSPSFFTSMHCRNELKVFVEKAGPNRIVKVVKFPGDRPFPLPDLPTYPFFRCTQEGLLQGLVDARYHQAVERLTQQIALLLDGVLKSNPITPSQTSQMDVFLCHSSADKPVVRNLWEKLKADGFAPWLDEKELLPGQQWELAIRKAIDCAGAILVCLSSGSINKEGFLQREIGLVIDKASEKPEDTIFLIPVRLEDCTVPLRLKEFHWVNLFEEWGYARLLQALQTRAATLWQQRD
ncbi:MAG TPA: toll/interleukin-1 receptor domain-containing protein [Candidatus Angelobacter sp.]|jgi:hypothetical protein|nr:toll/interleukin-1 receptor domain-containing protein [Candidatus Angelobacter sp.]